VIDRYIYPLQARLLQPAAQALAGRGVPANAVSAIGFVIGLAALPLLALRHYELALLAILANRLLDGLDGAIARCSQPTDRGAFIDIAFDFLFYAAVPLGFAIADPAANAVPAAVLLFGFMGTASSFLSFSAVAARKGLTADPYPTKGIYYLGGLTEGAETIAVFVAMSLWPAAFPTLAYIFAALCGITTLMRWWWGWRSL
jgi:phosphatidylglycerophosphate synthase